MRFYLDEDLSSEIAKIARARGLDVVSCHELGRNGLSDERQLRFAAEEGRCLVTRNRDDFEEQTVRFFEMEWSHAGLLIVPPSLPSDRFSLIAAALLDYDRQHPEGVPAYTIHFLRPPRS